MLSGIDPAEAVATLKKLGDERNDLNQASPQIPRFAYERAKKGTEKGETSYV